MSCDREKLIEMLEECDRCNAEYCNQCEFGDNIDGCVQRKKEIIADTLIAHGVTFAKDTDVPSKWISVEDRVPEGGKSIICLGIRGDIFIGKWMDILRKGDNVAHCHVIVGKHTVGLKCATHWMPLPTPPKED